MERKIGETFELLDEKYQVEECRDSDIPCLGCVFFETCLGGFEPPFGFIGLCAASCRSDKKEVIFTKL